MFTFNVMYEHFDYKILYIFFRELIRNRHISFYSIGGVIISMLALSTVDNGFETLSGQIRL